MTGAAFLSNGFPPVDCTNSLLQNATIDDVLNYNGTDRCMCLAKAMLVASINGSELPGLCNPISVSQAYIDEADPSRIADNKFSITDGHHRLYVIGMLRKLGVYIAYPVSVNVADHGVLDSRNKTPFIEFTS